MPLTLVHCPLHSLDPTRLCMEHTPTHRHKRTVRFKVGIKWEWSGDSNRSAQSLQGVAQQPCSRTGTGIGLLACSNSRQITPLSF